MLYSEFLAGTGAVDNQASYDEYKRVEQIYMESDHCTKADAYRMARVETVAEYEKRQKQMRKDELKWVMENIIPAAAYIRGMSEKACYFRDGGYWFVTPCGNTFELRLVLSGNCGSYLLYEFWCNGKKLDISNSGYNLLPSAEFQSYRADWHDKSLKELEELFGYIA